MFFFRSSVLLSIIFQFFLAFVGFVRSDGKILTVVALYRHGDRAPCKNNVYNGDPYDESYWPQGFDQLTNLGKKRQYELGKWLRHRYSGFLPAEYHKKFIHVRSSNTDRCLMSAASNLAGLYRPTATQSFVDDLPWQPVPIHTLPENMDAVLAVKKPCPKYDRLYTELMATEYYRKILESNADLFEYMTANTGFKVKTLQRVMDIYNTLYVESRNNLTLPKWTETIFPEPLESLSNFTWGSFTYTQDLARLKIGPLIDYIANHLEGIVSDPEAGPRFLMLSAHDSTVAYLLNALQMFDFTWPEFSTTIIFELKQNDADYYVNMYQKNSTDLKMLKLNDCDFDCPFDSFIDYLSEVSMTAEEWEDECQS